MNAVLAWFDAHPVIVASIFWPSVTAVVSLAQLAIAKRWPALWDALSAAGLDLPRLLRAISGGKAPDLRPLASTIELRDADRDLSEEQRLKRAYAALSRAQGGKNKDGLPLPEWAELSPVAREGYATFGRVFAERRESQA